MVRSEADFEVEEFWGDRLVPKILRVSSSAIFDEYNSDVNGVRT
jgi:hypothetical protein